LFYVMFAIMPHELRATPNGGSVRLALGRGLIA
jgi:hypothetical protein